MRRLLRIVIVLGVLVGDRHGVDAAEPRRRVDVALPDVAGHRSLTPVALASSAVDGTCPPGYEIKAKLSSGIFHEPGMVNYARTTPDRCYASAEAAEADGLRPAKR